MLYTNIFNSTSTSSDYKITSSGIPSDIPTGFDCVLQFSMQMLQNTMGQNLKESGVVILSARVPYQPETLTPELFNAIRPHISIQDSASKKMFVELILTSPKLQTLNWTPPVIPHPTPPVPPVTSLANEVTDQNEQIALLEWKLQVSLLKVSIIPTSTNAASKSINTFPNVISNITTSTDPSLPTGLPDGERIILAEGTSMMHIPTKVMVFNSLLQFSFALNFENVMPLYQSSDPVLQEFLGSNLAVGILGQAIRPLINQFELHITPIIALCGNLTPSQVASTQLLIFQVVASILQDRNEELLTLCVAFGPDSTNSYSLLKSFLSGHDFAYFIAQKFLNKILAVRWASNAIQTPITGEVQVEMPIPGDVLVGLPIPNSNATGYGRARLQIQISNKLIDATIKASANALGDSLALESSQIIQLLELWDPNNDPVEDLGDLANPATDSFLIHLQLFDQQPVDEPQNLNPVIEDFITKLIIPVYIPIKGPIKIENINGLTSSALQMLVVRWNMHIPPPFTPPIQTPLPNNNI